MSVATSTAIALAVGSAGATAASNIYSAHRAGSTNDKSLEAQKQADTTAAAIEREKMAQNEQARKDMMAVDSQHWNDYVRTHEPYWQTGQQAYGNLLQLANGGQASPMSMPGAPPQGAPPPGAPPQGAPTGQVVNQPAAPRSLMDVARIPTQGAPAAGTSMLNRGRAYANAPMPAPVQSNLMDLAKWAAMLNPNAAAKRFDAGSSMTGLA